jgi:hypothetical protein
MKKANDDQIGGMVDLKKAKHYLDKLIELEENQA